MRGSCPNTSSPTDLTMVLLHSPLIPWARTDSWNAAWAPRFTRTSGPDHHFSPMRQNSRGPPAHMWTGPDQLLPAADPVRFRSWPGKVAGSRYTACTGTACACPAPSERVVLTLVLRDSVAGNKFSLTHTSTHRSKVCMKTNIPSVITVFQSWAHLPLI